MLNFIYKISGLKARHEAEKAWIKKHGEIPDGHCLAYGHKDGSTQKVCYLKTTY